MSRFGGVPVVDAAECLGGLAALAGVSLTEGTAYDWDEIEADLGTRLPADYKLLAPPRRPPPGTRRHQPRIPGVSLNLDDEDVLYDRLEQIEDDLEELDKRFNDLEKTADLDTALSRLAARLRVIGLRRPAH
jgi:hypothetical protein